MQNLKEFLANANLNALLEELGSLDVIAPKFLQGLKTEVKLKMLTQPSPITGEIRKREVSVRTLSSNLGPKSPVTSKPFKSGADALKTLEENPNAIAIVITDGDYREQVLVITKQGRDTFKVGIDYPAIAQGLDSDDVHQIRMKFSKANLSVVDKVVFHAGQSHNEVYKILTIVTTALKSKRLPAEMHVLSLDIERQKQRNERSLAKRGVIPLANKSTIGSFGKQARKELLSRLETFKTTKAKNTSLEDLVDLILHEGYLDKIKINGFTYNMERDYLRFDELTKGNTSNRSYVEYEINQKSEEFMKLKTDFLEMIEKNRGLDSEKQHELRDKARENLPPRSIKIFLGMKGGAIIPVDTKTDIGLYFW